MEEKQPRRQTRKVRKMDKRIEEIEQRVAELITTVPYSFIKQEKLIWQVYEMGKQVGKIESEALTNILIDDKKKMQSKLENREIFYY